MRFIEPWEAAWERLNIFLKPPDLLSNDEFTEAQRLFVILFRLYEERRCWVRDIGWEIFPDLPTRIYYKQWEEADGQMRKELKKLRPYCSVLSKQIPSPDISDPWWWQTKSSL